MGDWIHQNAKVWLVPGVNNLELFRATAIRYNYARHSHAGYSIGVIEAGVGGNYYQGATYFAPPQSIILMNPEEAHTGYSAGDLPLTYRMLYPSVDCIQCVADDLQIRGFPYFKDAVVQNQRLTQALLSLHITLERAQDCLEYQSRLVEVFSAILLQYAEIKICPTRLHEEHQAVRLMKDYLHDHFSTSISLEQLVNVTNLNRSYLIRLFHQAVGMPPYTYLNQIRVEKAKQLLRQGMSVAEVAIAVGMSDQSHLTRHFKRIVGVTPGHYRKMSTSFKTG